MQAFIPRKYGMIVNMGFIKKVAKHLTFLLVFFLLFLLVWLKLTPSKNLSNLLGKSQLVDKYLCTYSTKVGGQSMNPLIPPGTSVSLTRCFEDQDLTEGVIVLYQDDSNLRFGIIRHILALTPVVYKISDEKAPELFHDIVKNEIAGINQEIDVSGSKYSAKQDAETFILKSDQYLTDLYLAKIPKGAGIESATLEKASSFSLKKDKFCAVIVPKVNLIAVAIEILDTTTENRTSLGNSIVLNASAEPNVNCIDFGSGPGMLDLKKGSYLYQFNLNRQILESIQFEVE